MLEEAQPQDIEECPSWTPSLHPNRQGGPPGAWRTSDAPVLPDPRQRSIQGRGPFSTALEGKVKSNQGPHMRRRASGAV